MSAGVFAKRAYVVLAVVVTVGEAIYIFNTRTSAGDRAAAAAIDATLALVFYALLFAGIYRLGRWIARKRRRA